MIQFEWTGNLDHRSTTSGVASSAARYNLVGDDIAKHIATTLTKEFDAQRRSRAPPPELPAEFYPAYRKPVALPWGEGGEPEQVWSWHGLMNHDETLWRITTDGPPAELIGRVPEAFQGGRLGRKRTRRRREFALPAL